MKFFDQAALLSIRSAFALGFDFTILICCVVFSFEGFVRCLCL